MLTHPVTLYWHRADQLCFGVPPSSWVPCKKRPLPFLNVFGMTGPSSNQESNPQILLVSAGSPLSSPFTISRGYWGPVHYQGTPSGAPTLDPHGAIPVTLYSHRADQLYFVVPTSLWVPCKQGPLPFFKVFGRTGPSTYRDLFFLWW